MVSHRGRRSVDLRDNNRCYVCGTGNPAGLQVAFEINRTDRSVTASFVPRPDHQGFENIVHGGILSALLDEAMAKLAFSLGIPAVTAEITVAFKSPAAPGDELAISGRLVKEAKKLVEAEAAIHRGPVLIAQAQAKLLVLRRPG